MSHIIGFRPLLAETVDDLSTLKFPLAASPKIDGIRCIKLGGKAVSRSLKTIPNKFVREWVEKYLPDGVDGELTLADHRQPFNEVSSAIMSHDGEPDFRFRAFDYVPTFDSINEPFNMRLRTLQLRKAKMREVYDIVPHQFICSLEQLLALHQTHLDDGYEGTMIRDPYGRYKFGRSTLKEGILLKMKPFQDEEATVIGVVEKMHNENPPEINELGRTKRSSAKAGKVPAGTLGALQCRTVDGAEFEIGTGFTDAIRDNLWRHYKEGNELAGRLVKFKHLPPPGGRKAGQKPRHPVFLGWRLD